MASSRNLELREQVGQLLVMGFEGTSMSARLRSILKTFSPGGVILFKRNVAEAAQVHSLLREIQNAASHPLFRCVDMEGGTVDRFRDIVARMPSVSEVAAAESSQLFRKHGKLIGGELRALGFNVDFAPCVDLASGSSNKVLGSRTVSSDPEKTISYARAFLRGLSEAGIIGCGKHFPGLGSADLDSHAELPIIRKSWKRLWNEDLLPYRQMRREFPFVMVCHAAYLTVTGDRTPASLSSKWIREILRSKIGFRGLVVSDDLDMGGVLAATSIEDAAVQTLQAGADIFLVCQKEESVWRAFEGVCKTAERDRRFSRLVAEKCRRVLRFKNSSHGVTARMSRTPSPLTVERLRRSIWEFTEEIRLHSLVAEDRAL